MGESEAQWYAIKKGGALWNGMGKGDEQEGVGCRKNVAVYMAQVATSRPTGYTSTNGRTNRQMDGHELFAGSHRREYKGGAVGNGVGKGVVEQN